MSERKVLNKYYPPNFDPALIPKVKKVKERQHKVRLMAPFSMRCESCGEYIYKGKKFNARKETVKGETYYSILIFRFYIRCPRCAAEITFKTDPKNADYVAEHGVSRNFEPWRDENEINDARAKQKELEEENNPLKALENRTKDSKRELEIMDGLDEIRTRNARMERMDAAEILDKLIETNDSEEDERIAKETFRAKREREKELDSEPEDGEDKQEKLSKLFVKKLVESSGINNNNWVKPIKKEDSNPNTKLNTDIKKPRIIQAKKASNSLGIMANKDIGVSKTSSSNTLLADYSDSDDE